jgi:predicted permease
MLAAGNVGIPVPAARLFELLGASAGPGALFAIGIFLVGKGMGHQRVEIAWMSFAKLCVHPLITWILVTWVFSMDPFWAASAIFIAAMPAGSALFVVAQKAGIEVERMSATILVSTVLSVATLSVLLVRLFPL